MKFVIYKDQNKFTVDNVSLPDPDEFSDLDTIPQNYTLQLDELDLCNFRITSLKSTYADIETFLPEIEVENEPGIDWQRETIN